MDGRGKPAESSQQKGSVLQSRADLLARLARYEEALGAYHQPANAFDQALHLAPDYANAHRNKAITLSRWGRCVRYYWEEHTLRRLWEEAQTHVECMLELVPQEEQARGLLSLIWT